ncbi:hypothetical protein PHYC_03908 [Phycisphaerales bacterium]|nr:hypothetical protein PHYC_03908 [Phycisphaerales bacterium]
MQPKALTIIGWILTALVTAFMAFSAIMKFINPPEVTKSFVEQFGYPANTLLPIGIAEIACALLFLFPRTAVLGAILLTGYLGGAIATHVRVGDPFIPPAIVGVAAWLALYLREPRLRALAPIHKPLPKP